MPKRCSVRPPRFADWLLGLFLPERKDESIRGDLLEEFLKLAACTGVPSARRWYWRQTVKTVLHFTVTGYRAAPWMMAGFVLAGYFLLAYGYRLPELAIVAVLHRYRAYVHVSLYALWMIWVPLAIEIGRVLVAAFVGGIVGVAAKRNGVAAAMTIGLIFAVPTIIQFSVFAVQHSAVAIHFFLPQVVTNLVASVAVVKSGTVVRQRITSRAFLKSAASA